MRVAALILALCALVGAQTMPGERVQHGAVCPTHRTMQCGQKADRLTLDDVTEVWPSIPDVKSGQAVHSLIISPTLTLDPAGIATGTATDSGTGNTDSSKWWAIEVSPVITSQAGIPEFSLVKSTGSYTQAVSDVLLEQVNLFSSNFTIQSGTANVAPPLPDTFYDSTTVQQTAGASTRSYASVSFISTKFHKATASGASLTLTGVRNTINSGDYGLVYQPTVAAVSGATVALDQGAAVLVRDLTKTGAGTMTVTNYGGLDCNALTGGTTNWCMRSAVASGANNYTIKDDGGAQWKATGKFTTYNADTTAGNGVPGILASVTNQTGKTAAIGSTNLVASTPALGLYRVSVYLLMTTAGTSGTIKTTIGYTDAKQAQTQDSSTVNIASAGDKVGQTFVVETTSASAITYSTTITGTIGSGVYSVYLEAERMT